jgi:homospermidine synthase
LNFVNFNFIFYFVDLIDREFFRSTMSEDEVGNAEDEPPVGELCNGHSNGHHQHHHHHHNHHQHESAKKKKKILGRIRGRLVMIGFGSIGRGVYPLIVDHLQFDHSSLVVIDPSDAPAAFLAAHNVTHQKIALVESNYKAILTPLLQDASAFVVNLSVDTCSLSLMRLCRELGALYIDTVVEPWAGFYFDSSRSNAERTNYALRQLVRDEKRRADDAGAPGPTAISCCGANPGLVSWLVKEALLLIAHDTDHEAARLPVPTTRAEWARLMQSLGVKGVHIAERDTQQSAKAKRPGTFVNTWSVDGFISEAFQPAELGWGTNERWFPDHAHRHESGCQSAIWINHPGALTKVFTWCPGLGPQYGFLVTHNEAISISDYYTVGEGARPEYRPTCHYAYHPCDAAVLSLHEAFGSGETQKRKEILDEADITDGRDELGVLLFGHSKNALWYGSRLSIESTRKLAPYQNATGLQVTASVLAGIVWALENPNAGIVEADEMDHERCLEIARPFLGQIEAHYTDWTPLSRRWTLFADQTDLSDPWQFLNVLAT